MPFNLSGTASDELPQVLAAGATDVELIFTSMSAREPRGRDAEYLEWHSLDHRPEQYRVAGLRHSMRVVSTPACRAARACSDSRYAAVDHVMTYFFAAGAALDQFSALSAALSGDRRPFRLPSVDANYFSLAGKVAARRAMAGADVIPWRPARGVYLLVEQGLSSPSSLAEVAGVAGIWWLDGGRPIAGFPDTSGLRLTYCFLDGEPVETAERLRATLEQRWRAGSVVPLLAAPFHTLVPFEWARYLP
ncbi:MAG: hypothetical protein ACLPV8_12280 [Steroidobacteraceae bacterium]